MKHFIVYSPHDSALLITNMKGELPELVEGLEHIKINDEYAISFTQDRGLHIPGYKFNSFLFLKLGNEVASLLFKGLSYLFPFLSQNNESSKFQDFCIKTPASVTFYGGSFNPWHAGHEACIELCPTKQELYILPDNNPQKTLSNSCLWENYKKILYVQKSYPQLRIYTGFWSLTENNPTANWLIPLKQTTKMATSLLVGYDSFIGIDTWIESEELLKNLDSIQVVSREDDEKVFMDKSKNYKAINSKIDIKQLGHHLFESVSSSSIRNHEK